MKQSPTFGTDSAGETSMKPSDEVFLSYSREDLDLAEFVFAVSKGIKLSLWFDIEDIPIGTSWDGEIGEALDRCSAIILIASQFAFRSEFVLRELRRCVSRSKDLYVLCFDNAELPEALTEYPRFRVADVRDAPFSEERI